MPAAVLVWVIWFALVVGAGIAAVTLLPGRRAPARWASARRRCSRVVETMVAELGTTGAAVVVYLAGAAAVVAVCWPLGLLAHAAQGPVDWPIFRWTQAHQVGWWSSFWLRATNIGMPRLTQAITAVAAIFFAVVWAIRRLPWWRPLVALPLGYLLEKWTQIILKAVVHRGHPPTTLGTYPSGGCARVAVVYGMVIFLTVAWLWPERRRMWWAGWVLTACLISIQAYARLYNLEHWSTDVVGGTVFGVLLLLVMCGCLRILCPVPAFASRQAFARDAHGREPVAPSGEPLLVPGSREGG